MKLFRHYKNKPYKYLGVAKHSESLEDLVLYETLYKNDLGKLWVRPRKMFEEQIELNGKLQDRFAKIQLEISIFDNPANSELAELKSLIDLQFKDFEFAKLVRELENHKAKLLLKAYIERNLVGFQVGYAQSSQVFFSILTGVVSEYKSLGIASDLNINFEKWCIEHGYKKVQTRLYQKQRELLIFSLKKSFEIIGTEIGKSADIQIILEKSLGNS